MQKTKIEWADYVWNPIRGLCPVGCWYCYARRMYQRFKWPIEISLDTTPIEYYSHIPKDSRVFVCSTMELFHPNVPAAYRDYIFRDIELYKKLTFIILTKMPERIDRPMPENVWLGVSVTGNSNIDYLRVRELENAQAKTKFVSLEPLLADPCIWDLFNQEYPAWLIVGRLTGHGRRYDPKLATLTEIAEFGAVNKIPVFFKDNLRSIWPGRLIQEWPR